jgi:large subunit ribosomal protein L10
MTDKVKVVPEYKKETVKELAAKMKKSRCILLASTKGLPSSQFHDIKKKLRGKAEIKVAKKSLIIRAIEATDKGVLQNMKKDIASDMALFFSEMDPFELSGWLSDNKSSTKAKAGDIAPEDIHIEPGPTDLVPGPAISELSGVGLKVAVEGGKLAIKTGAVVAKAGEPIKPNVAGVLGKLGISPMKVGFEPIEAYDSKDDKIYVGIKIDKSGALDILREAISKGFGFAVNIKYMTQQTVKYFIAKAGMEEKALSAKINVQQNSQEVK